MLHNVTEMEFMKLMMDKERFKEGRSEMVAPLFRSLFIHWSSRLHPLQTSILGYVVASTFVMGKQAQRITIAEFAQGCAMGVNTARRHIHALIADGFLHVYRTAGEAGGEKEARMFEVDCNFMLRVDEDYVRMTLKHPQKGVPPLPERESPLPQRETPTYINYIDSSSIHSRDKSLHSARSSQNGSGMESPMLATPKKPRAEIARPTSMADVLATVQGKAATAQIARATSAGVKAPHHVDKLEMQALLDKAMKTYAPTATRMMVTAKEFGFLRKRLKEAPPNDLPVFINWVVSYWPTIAHQNRMAKQRRTEETTHRTVSALPMAPDFASLCYRYPYFLKAFSNHNAERTQQETEVKSNAEVERLKRTLKDKDRDIGVLRSKLAKPLTVMRRTPPAQRVIGEPRPVRAELPDAELPDWSDNGR